MCVGRLEGTSRIGRVHRVPRVLEAHATVTMINWQQSRQPAGKKQPSLGQCWRNVSDVAPALLQRWDNV